MSNDTEYMITVEGKGSVEVDPDIAVIVMGVVTEDNNIQKATQENKMIINNVINGLYNQGIDEQSVKTISYTVYPQYDYNNGKKTFRGYEVRHILEVEVTELDNIGLILEEAVNNGINYQQGVTFEISNSTKYYNEALSKAVKDSVDKARNIANTVNGRIIEQPVKVTEKPSGNITPYRSFTSENSIPIQTQKLEITASIESVFKYMSNTK